MDEKNKREMRAFEIYSGSELVLKIEDKAGRLISMASPPVTGFPEHAFVNGQSFSAIHEGTLKEILDASSSFDEYLTKLISKNYNIRSHFGVLSLERKWSMRILSADKICGALWPGEGQISGLKNQPKENQLHKNVSLTIYEEDCLDLILKQISSTSTLEDITERLTNAGFKLLNN
jgi:hypothetical protein